MQQQNVFRAADPAQLIRSRLRLGPVPALPEIRLHMAHPGSGLRRLLGADAPPYWAWPWAGGAVLARHFLDAPETVQGRRLLDLGAGSGVVGIAAMLAGAEAVLAAETDPMGLSALTLNAAANGVTLSPLPGDLLDGPPPAVELVAVGDLFYEAALARRVTAFLDRCVAAEMEVLIGDPGRAHLPRQRLQPVAAGAVPDFGAGVMAQPAAVYRFG